MVNRREGSRVSTAESGAGLAHPSRDAVGVRADGYPFGRSRMRPSDIQERKAPPVSRVWIILIPVCTALGLGSVAVANAAARNGDKYSDALEYFFAGLLLIFIPVAVRVLMQKVSRRERLILIMLLGVAFYVAKILGSPSTFTFIDEYIHLRNTENILTTHHLFGLNPLLPTAAYYPGLAAVCAGLVNLTGLSPFVCGLIIIGVARVIISACFFLVAEKVTRSHIAAAAASLIYAVNPMFLFWSSSFSYEDLALPLAAFAIWWIARTHREAGRLIPIVTVAVVAAIAVTHHIAAFALTALLVAWWLTERLTKQPPARQRGVGLMAFVAGSISLVWFFVVAKPAASYLLGENLFPAAQQIGSLLTGRVKARQPYSGTASAAPAWYMLAGFAAVGLLVSALPAAVYRAWRLAFGRRKTLPGRRRRIHVPMVVAIAVAIVFPLSLLPRLTANAGALASRSSEYVFTGLGCVLALLAEEAVRSRRGKSKAAHPEFRRWLRTLVAVVMITTIFVGDVTIGTTYAQLLPESSHPQGYPWMVQPDVIAASEWAREHLGIDQRFGVNIIDSQALATYGQQDTVSEQSVWPIFLTDTMNSTVVNTIKSTKIRYLFVDWNMTKGLPANPGDYYFSPWEPQSNEYKRPLPAAMLEKFTTSTCAHLIYSSGPIQIFNVTRIENGSCVPGKVNGRRHEVRRHEVPAT
jgi:hypothetical protein